MAIENDNSSIFSKEGMERERGVEVWTGGEGEVGGGEGWTGGEGEMRCFFSFPGADLKAI